MTILASSIPEYKIKLPIRQIDYYGLKIGGDKAISFMSENGNESNPLFGLEIPYVIDPNTYPKVLFDLWKDKDFFERIKFANETVADLISIKFNIIEDKLDEEINKIVSLLPKIFDLAKKPLIFRGANNKNIDKKLLSELAKKSEQRVIIAFADDITYENIASETAKKGHLLVLRSPIDINLAKELNILAQDQGMSLDHLLIDPDMGALGYGIDYGFSIVEKIKQSAFDDDKLLNMPIIIFAGEEAFKAKEAKSSNFDLNWGNYEDRAIMWEIATVTPMISAGANIAVLWHPQSIKTLKEVLE